MHRRERSTPLLHWLAAMALPLALIAALLPTARPASAAQQSGTALTWQVYTCPTDYAGTDYLADCTPGGASYDISLTDTSGTVVQQGSTDASGSVTFTGLAGDITSTLGVPGDFAHFYLACFDTTSGSEVFLFDGTGNQVTETFSGDAGSSVSCR